MKQLITPNWQPSPKTINALIAGGWSEEQRNRNLIKFVFDKRYANKEIKGASSIYSSWVRFETPRAKKEKETGKALKTVMEEKSHSSKDGAKKAQQAKQQEGTFTKAEAIAWYESHR